MKTPPASEVKLVWGRSTCGLSPSSTSARDCSALFTPLPWETHSWLIGRELAVQHECDRREKPDECLGRECLTWFHAICGQILSISISHFSLFYSNLFFFTFSESMCRKLNPSPDRVFLRWPEWWVSLAERDDVLLCRSVSHQPCLSATLYSDVNHLRVYSPHVSVCCFLKQTQCCFSHNG